MKKILMIVIIIAVLVLILSFAKDAIIKGAIEDTVRSITGLRLSIGSFKADILNSFFEVGGLVLFNPSEYRDRIMADIPEIYVSYDLPSIISRKARLPQARIEVREFMVVKNEKGELNLNSLKAVQAKKGRGAPSQKGKKETESKPPEIKIDNLELKIERVIYKDYSATGGPLIMQFNINLDERYQNVTDPYALVNLIIVRALINTTISNIINFDLRLLEKTAEKAIKEALQVTDDTAKDAEEVVKKTTEMLKDIFKFPLKIEEK